MTAELVVHSAGPAVMVQDAGRPGWIAQGLSRGGAADPVALAEGAALLGQDPGLAALEMAGLGGEFSVTAPTRIALTGAVMDAAIDGRAVPWNASHALRPGQRLRIGSARQGVHGYLHLGGGIDTPVILGARAAHLAAGIGAPLAPGDRLPIGADGGTEVGFRLDPVDRFAARPVRVLASAQSAHFGQDFHRFLATEFRRGARANRMGIALDHAGAGFGDAAGLTILSEIAVPGDIQIAGDGQPYVLMVEAQTTGGYPRVATVIPADLPRLAQAQPGAAIRFRLVDRAEALAAEADMRRALAGLPARRRPLVRDPRDVPDLLSQQLISGVTTGWDDLP